MRVELTRPAMRVCEDHGVPVETVRRWLGDWICEYRPQRVYKDALGLLYARCNAADARRAVRRLKKARP